MIQDLHGKVAVVTGAGEGIGERTAIRLAEAGAAVIVNDLDPRKAEAVVAAITANGGRAVPHPGDVADVAVTRAMVARAVEAFGRLDIALCNAGLTSWGNFFDFPVEEFDRVMAVNLRGSYYTAQAAARQMRAQGEGGRILFSSSITGAQAVAYVSAYAMCKAALRMLARNLVIELSPHRITVNALLIGATVTPRNLRDDPDYDAHWGAVIPLGRAAQPDDIASAALFLCSDAASFITGATLAVDGGWSCVSPTPELKFVQHHEAARQK